MTTTNKDKFSWSWILLKLSFETGPENIKIEFNFWTHFRNLYIVVIDQRDRHHWSGGKHLLISFAHSLCLQIYIYKMFYMLINKWGAYRVNLSKHFILFWWYLVQAQSKPNSTNSLLSAHELYIFWNRDERDFGLKSKTETSMVSVSVTSLETEV